MRGRLHHGTVRGTKADVRSIPSAVGTTPVAMPAKPPRLKRGGHVKGKKPHARLDKRARGGALKTPKTVRDQSKRKLCAGGVERAEGGAVKAGDEQANRLSRKNPPKHQPAPDEGEDPEDDFEEPRAKGGGIHIKPSHKGLLHKDLGVPEGKPIPAAKLAKAKNSENPAVRRRATFADNAKHWNH